MFHGPSFIVSTMQAGTTPIFNIFDMTGPSSNRESNPQNLLVSAGSPLSSPKRQNSPQYDDKNMLGNIGNLFVECNRQVSKGHLYHLLGVSDYYVLYRQRAKSLLLNI